MKFLPIFGFFASCKIFFRQAHDLHARLLMRLLPALRPAFHLWVGLGRRAHTDQAPTELPWKMRWIIARTGETKEVRVAADQKLLDVARQNEVSLEGACEGACRCSTCHIQIQDPKIFAQIESDQPATDEENDMLDEAFDLQPTSRLACQLRMRLYMDGVSVRIPEATRNMAVDGYVPTHH
jgi:ferredoxin